MTDPDPDNLTCTFNVRVNKATRDDLVARARRAGLRPGTWLRVEVCKMLAALRAKEAKK